MMHPAKSPRLIQILKGKSMFADARHPAHAATPPSIWTSLLAAVPLLRLAPQVANSRARLLDMDDAMLADIGLTRTEARQEAARPVWDVPANWRAGK